MSLSPAESTLTDEQVGRRAFDDSPGIVIAVPPGAPIVPDDIRRYHKMKTHAPRPGTKHRRHRQECMDPKCRETSKLLGLNPKKGIKYCESVTRPIVKTKISTADAVSMLTSVKTIYGEVTQVPSGKNSMVSGK